MRKRALLVSTLLVVIVAATLAGWRYRESDHPCGTVEDALAELAPLDASVLGIAHNAGAGVAEVRRALDCGGDVIELDVIAAGGHLRVSHEAPAGSEGDGESTLGALWPTAAEAPTIKLDPKRVSPQLTELLIDFLRDPAHGGVDVAVTTNDVTLLEALREHVPEIQRFLTVETRAELDRLRADPDLASLLHGVSIEEGLLDDGTVAWLHERQLRIWAWTVNDPRRVMQLADLGVEGIATDNLALLLALEG